MSVTCHVLVGDEDDGSINKPQTPKAQVFEQLPRVGEFVSFSRDGKPDDDGVFRNDLFRVLEVHHIATTDSTPATTFLKVVLERAKS